CRNRMILTYLVERTTLPPVALETVRPSFMRSSVRIVLSLCVLLLARRTLSASTSTVRTPTWTFNTPGTYTVTLQSCNWFTCSVPLTRSVTVLDPNPALTLATSDGLGSIIGGGAVSVHAGQLVHLLGR